MGNVDQRVRTEESRWSYATLKPHGGQADKLLGGDFNAQSKPPWRAPWTVLG